MLQTSVAATEPLIPHRARSEVARRLGVYLLLVAIALLFFTPFIWSLSTSFKTLPETVYYNLIPHPFTAAAWMSVWTEYDFKRYALSVVPKVRLRPDVSGMKRCRNALDSLTTASAYCTS